MAVEASGAMSELVQVVAVLAAGVVTVPPFKRIGLGSVLGYLVAGLAIGPFGLGRFSDAHAILHSWGRIMCCCDFVRLRRAHLNTTGSKC